MCQHSKSVANSYEFRDLWTETRAFYSENLVALSRLKFTSAIHRVCMICNWHLYLKGIDSVVVSQNKSFVHRKSMDNLPRKFEPGKWTFRNRDSRSNETQIVFATAQILL